MPDPVEEELLFFGPFALDTARRALCRDGLYLRLAPKEFTVLTMLVRQAGKAVSKEVLLAEVWPGVAVGDTSLARCVSSLRRHFGANAIQAVPKFGYRFTLAVTTEFPAPSETPALAAPEAQPETPAVLAGPVTSIPAARSRRWIWSALAATVVLAAVLLGAAWVPWQVPWSKPTATWTDPQTGLTWQRQDNGAGRPRGQADLTRDAALAYCASLQLEGRRDWRLPTIEELQTLHNPAQSAPGLWGGYRPVYWHVKGGLLLSGGETAGDLTFLTDLAPAGQEQSYDFSFGRRNRDPVDFQSDHRALCVRASK